MELPEEVVPLLPLLWSNAMGVTEIRTGSPKSSLKCACKRFPMADSSLSCSCNCFRTLSTRPAGKLPAPGSATRPRLLGADVGVADEEEMYDEDDTVAAVDFAVVVVVVVVGIAFCFKLAEAIASLTKGRCCGR